MRLAKRTLVSFGNHTCNFAIMFGVLEIVQPVICIFKKLSAAINVKMVLNPCDVEIQKNKTDAMHCGRFVF